MLQHVHQLVICFCLLFASEQLIQSTPSLKAAASSDSRKQGSHAPPDLVGAVCAPKPVQSDTQAYYTL